MSKDEFKSAVLWHMNGCVATLYTSDGNKKKPTDTLSFVTKAYLSFLHLNEVVRKKKVQMIPYLLIVIIFFYSVLLHLLFPF